MSSYSCVVLFIPTGHILFCIFFYIHFRELPRGLAFFARFAAKVKLHGGSEISPGVAKATNTNPNWSWCEKGFFSHENTISNQINKVALYCAGHQHLGEVPDVRRGHVVQRRRRPLPLPLQPVRRAGVHAAAVECVCKWLELAKNFSLLIDFCICILNIFFQKRKTVFNTLESTASLFLHEVCCTVHFLFKSKESFIHRLFLVNGHNNFTFSSLFMV